MSYVCVTCRRIHTPYIRIILIHIEKYSSLRNGSQCGTFAVRKIRRCTWTNDEGRSSQSKHYTARSAYPSSQLKRTKPNRRISPRMASRQHVVESATSGTLSAPADVHLDPDLSQLAVKPLGRLVGPDSVVSIVAGPCVHARDVLHRGSFMSPRRRWRGAAHAPCRTLPTECPLHPPDPCHVPR